MGRKSKRHKIDSPPTAEDFAKDAAGETVRFTQFDTLALMLETAIRLWATESEPLSILLLVSAVYRCLNDLSGKIGILRSEVGHEQFTKLYDYLRHASPGRDLDFVFGVGSNQWMLFETISSFESYFRRLSPLMRTFQAYFMVVLLPAPATSDELLKFLPDGVHVDEIARLTRRKFFDKLFPLFVSDASKNPAAIPVRSHIF